jgi:hypothetical protein
MPREQVNAISSGSNVKEKGDGLPAANLQKLSSSYSGGTTKVSHPCSLLLA